MDHNNNMIVWFFGISIVVPAKVQKGVDSLSNTVRRSFEEQKSFSLSFTMNPIRIGRAAAGNSLAS